jgi:hypothetical protein
LYEAQARAPERADFVVINDDPDWPVVYRQ